VVLLIDGAAGLENMGLVNFRDATQIVDFYHARPRRPSGGSTPGSKDTRIQDPAPPLGPTPSWQCVENLIKETRQECAGQPQAQSVEEQLATSSTISNE